MLHLVLSLVRLHGCHRSEKSAPPATELSADILAFGGMLDHAQHAGLVAHVRSFTK